MFTDSELTRLQKSAKFSFDSTFAASVIISNENLIFNHLYNILYSVAHNKVDVRDNTNVFVVSNYHMPYAYQLPAVMKMHAKTAYIMHRKFSGIYPHIFVGDFNSKPHSDIYNLLSEQSRCYELQM